MPHGGGGGGHGGGGHGGAGFGGGHAFAGGGAHGGLHGSVARPGMHAPIVPHGGAAMHGAHGHGHHGHGGRRFFRRFFGGYWWDWGPSGWVVVSEPVCAWVDVTLAASDELVAEARAQLSDSGGSPVFETWTDGESYMFEVRSPVVRMPRGDLWIFRCDVAATASYIGQPPAQAERDVAELLAMIASVRGRMTDHDRAVLEMGLRSAHGEEAIAHGELERAHAQLTGAIAATQAAGLMGQAPSSGHKVWSEIQPDDSGDFQFQSGQRYAVLASASKNYSLAQIVSYMHGKGWTITYSWEQGTPTRGQYAIDSWLDGLPPDTTSNHRWVYGEGDLDGASMSVGQDAPWPLTIYHVAHVFQAVDGPAQAEGSTAAPSLPANAAGCPSAPSRIPYFVGGAAMGVGAGLLLKAALG